MGGKHVIPVARVLSENSSFALLAEAGGKARFADPFGLEKAAEGRDFASPNVRPSAAG